MYIAQQNPTTHLSRLGGGRLARARSHAHVGQLVRTRAHTSIKTHMLVNVSARANGRVGPVNLVGLTDFHSDAVLPLVLGGEFRISSVIVVATEAIANVFVPKAARGSRNVTMGTISVLIVLSDGVVFGSQVPVDVDGAQTGLVVRLRVGLVSDIHQTFVTLGDIGASLLESLYHLLLEAVGVREVLVARAGVVGLLVLSGGPPLGFGRPTGQNS